jgi:hypothetical protein
MKMIQDSEQFHQQLALWYSKNLVMEAFEVVTMTSYTGVTYELVVKDYMTFDFVLIDKGPYKTLRGAFGALGAAIDKIKQAETEYS